MSRRRQKSEDEETTYWLSYSDMMAALLLIFVLIISFTMLQAKKQYEQKEHELEEQRAAAEAQEKLLEEQQTQLAEQQEVLESQQEQLDNILGVRSGLVEALKAEFEGTDMKVSVDPKTGAITLDASILFDVNQYNLKKGGKDFLKEFVPRYLSVLLKPEFKDYVSEIIIEGHTDTEGGYMMNLALSQDRASSVAKFCIDPSNGVLSNEEIEELKKILTANGRSYSDPILNDDGTVNMDASRRVEFKFRLKDDEMIDEMMNILN